jgi:arylsulfatase A-like enzyme
MRSHLVHHSAVGEFAIRRGEWKLILDAPPDAATAPTAVEAGGQLYNLSRDPHERSDQYVDYPEVVSELRALLERERRQGRAF